MWWRNLIGHILWIFLFVCKNRDAVITQFFKFNFNFNCSLLFAVESTGGTIGPVDSWGQRASVMPWKCVILVLLSPTSLLSCISSKLLFVLLVCLSVPLFTFNVFVVQPLYPPFSSHPCVLPPFSSYLHWFSLFSPLPSICPSQKTSLLKTRHCFLGLTSKEGGRMNGWEASLAPF